MIRLASILTAVTVVFAAAGPALAEDDATSLSYISYLERYATLRPGNGDESLDAVVNMPILAGDRLVTARAARVEVVLADHTTVWLDEFSTVDFDALAYSRDHPAPRTVLYLADGTLALELPAHGLGEQALRLDTPTGTLYLQRPGLYRLDLDGGRLSVQAFSGLAELPAGAGSSLLRGGQQARLEGGKVWETRVLYEPRDEFWRWVSERRRPAAPGRTAEQVGSRLAHRAAILDSYGEWIYVDSYWAWRPRVAVSWVPYSYGRWYWTPVGWTWISYEPWGWYPYHYGSWTYHPRYGWLWCWDWVWGPAWVHWFYSGSYIGWCPRGYYDWWYWHRYRHSYDRSYPARWSQVTLDFRGRIYLDDVDLRPWTVVPATHFTHARLERVRVSPERLRQELPRATAYVRTGPLLTREVRPGPETFEREFRRGLREDNVPDLTRVLRREEGPVGGREVAPAVRMLPTRDLVRGAERLESSNPAERREPSRREGRERERDSAWPGVREPLPPRGGQPRLGGADDDRRDEMRPPLRTPDRAGPERMDGGPPPRGGSPGTPGREVGRPAPERRQPGGAPAPSGSSDADERRAPARSGPPAARPPSDSSRGRGDAPSPRPPASSIRPAPPSPSEPDTPGPSQQRHMQERSHFSEWEWTRPGRPEVHDSRVDRVWEVEGSPSSQLPRREADPLHRVNPSRGEYPSISRSSNPAPRPEAAGAVAPPLRSAPEGRPAAPRAPVAGESPSARAPRGEAPARPAPSRPDD